MGLLSLDMASTIIDRALAMADEKGIAPLCVIVLDSGAHPIALKRADGASLYRWQIAQAKATGCLGMGFGGREIARRAAAAPAFYASLGQVVDPGILPVPGGVLIRDAGGALLGAVGISGDTGDNDELCAVAGIEAAGLIADTGAAREG